MIWLAIFGAILAIVYIAVMARMWAGTDPRSKRIGLVIISCFLIGMYLSTLSSLRYRVFFVSIVSAMLGSTYFEWRRRLRRPRSEIEIWNKMHGRW